MGSGNKKVEIEKVSYYNKGKLEVFDIVDELLTINELYTKLPGGFYIGSTIKYIFRAGMKPGTKASIDLKKAAYNLNRFIEKVEAAEEHAESANKGI